MQLITYLPCTMISNKQRWNYFHFFIFISLLISPLQAVKLLFVLDSNYYKDPQQSSLNGTSGSRTIMVEWVRRKIIRDRDSDYVQYNSIYQTCTGLKFEHMSTSRWCCIRRFRKCHLTVGSMSLEAGLGNFKDSQYFKFILCFKFVARCKFSVFYSNCHTWHCMLCFPTLILTQ